MRAAATGAAPAWAFCSLKTPGPPSRDPSRLLAGLWGGMPRGPRHTSCPSQMAGFPQMLLKKPSKRNERCLPPGLKCFALRRVWADGSREDGVANARQQGALLVLGLPLLGAWCPCSLLFSFLNLRFKKCSVILIRCNESNSKDGLICLCPGLVLAGGGRALAQCWPLCVPGPPFCRSGTRRGRVGLCGHVWCVRGYSGLQAGSRVRMEGAPGTGPRHRVAQGGGQGAGLCPSGRAIWPSCRQTSPHAWLHTLILLDVGLRAPGEAIWGLSFSPILLPKNSTLKQQRERELPEAPGWTAALPSACSPRPLSSQTPDPGPTCRCRGVRRVWLLRYSLSPCLLYSVLEG